MSYAPASPSGYNEAEREVSAMVEPQEKPLPVENAAEAALEARVSESLTCPHCWTSQSARRAFCWQCGAILKNEMQK